MRDRLRVLRQWVRVGLLLGVVSCCHLALAQPFTVVSRVDSTLTGSDGSSDRTLHYVDTMTVEVTGPATAGTLSLHFIAQEVRTRRLSVHSRREFKLEGADSLRLSVRSDPLAYSRDKPRDKTASARPVRFSGWVLVFQPRAGPAAVQASSPEVGAWFSQARRR